MAGEDKILKLEQFEKYNTDLKAKLRWTGTRAEYDLIATKDQYTVYYISDEKKIIRNGIEYGGGSGEYLPITGGTLRGNLVISYGNPQFVFDGDNARISQRYDAAAVAKNHIFMDSDGINLNHIIDTRYQGHGIKIKKEGEVELKSTTSTGEFSECSVNLGNDGKLKLDGTALIGTAIEAFFNRIYPVGITYVQYTDTDNPNTLFPGTTWDDITNTIVSSGCRYPAFSPLNVGMKLDQELPNIRGEMNATPCAASGWIGNGAFGESGKWGDYGCGYGNNYANGHYIFNANQSNGIYKDGANVQPYTYTVKLWKRVS